MFFLHARLVQQIKVRLLLLLALLLIPITTRSQGGGVASTGTGGSDIIQGYIFFPSGRRADGSAKVKLQSFNSGDITVMADINGSFMFRDLSPGNYTIVVDAGEDYEIAQEAVTIDTHVNPSRSIGAVASTSRRYSVMINLQPKSTSRAKPAVINAALAEVPEQARRLYEKALELAAAGQTIKAIDNLRAAISIFPNFPLALNELGVQYLMAGQANKAVEVLTNAAALTPGNVNPNLNLGIALLEANRFGEAEKKLRDVLQLDSNIMTAHMYLGIALVRLDKIPEAESELRRVADSGGNQLGLAHYYLGGIYWQRHEYRRAADELDMYLKLNPNTPDSLRVRATIRDLRRKT